MEIVWNQIRRQARLEDFTQFSLGSEGQEKKTEKNVEKHEEQEKRNTLLMTVQAPKLETVHEYRYAEIRRQFLPGSQFLKQPFNQHNRSKMRKNVIFFFFLFFFFNDSLIDFKMGSHNVTLGRKGAGAKIIGLI